MSLRRLLALTVALALLLPAVATAAPAPSVLAGPCLAGGSYDPACDVDRDGDVDIFDIQLTAGRWNTNGVWTADGWSLTGNAGTTPGTNFLGTTDNQALQLRVNGSRALLIQPGAGPNDGPNIISGVSDNSASPGVFGATISGGGSPGNGNRIYDSYGSVGGGKNNQAGNDDGFPGFDMYATVGGGYQNAADGAGATVAGGSSNTASGDLATVAGGSSNTALGNYSFAAGYRAKANHGGAFVWADSQESDFSSTAANTFRVRALNGAFFQANNASYAGVVDNDGNGDGLRAFTASSQGNNYAALYASNAGTSPGLVAQTAGTYAGYFNDQIFVTGGCTGCTLMYVAQNAGDAALQPGDLVSAAGVADALPGTVDPVLRVQPSGPSAPGVVGVVYSRAAVTPSEKEGEMLDSVQAADGAAQPGDYLLIVVQGVAQVKVAKGETLTPGQRLKASDVAGEARGLRTVEVDGVMLDEGGAVIGVLLDAPDAASGLAPVMVTLR